MKAIIEYFAVADAVGYASMYYQIQPKRRYGYLRKKYNNNINRHTNFI